MASKYQENIFKTWGFWLRLLGAVMVVGGGYLIAYAQFMTDTQYTITSLNYSISRLHIYLIGVALGAIPITISYFKLEFSIYKNAVLDREVKDLRSKEVIANARYEQIAASFTTYFGEIFEALLNDLFNELNFNEQDRITIYKIDGDVCMPIARVALDREFRKHSTTTPYYPLNRGLIGKAWRVGEAHDYDMPEDPLAWCRYQSKNWKFTHQTASPIRMKSRSMLAINIDFDSTRRVSLAVIVFESMDPTKISGAKLTEMRAIHEERLADLRKKLCDYNKYGPSSAISASEENF